MNLLKLSFRVTQALSRKHAQAALAPSLLKRGFATAQVENQDDDLLPKPVITRVDRINDTTLCVNFSDDTQCSFNTVWVGISLAPLASKSVPRQSSGAWCGLHREPHNTEAESILFPATRFMPMSSLRASPHARAQNRLHSV